MIWIESFEERLCKTWKWIQAKTATRNVSTTLRHLGSEISEHNDTCFAAVKAGSWNCCLVPEGKAVVLLGRRRDRLRRVTVGPILGGPDGSLPGVSWGVPTERETSFMSHGWTHSRRSRRLAPWCFVGSSYRAGDFFHEAASSKERLSSVFPGGRWVDPYPLWQRVDSWRSVDEAFRV